MVRRASLNTLLTWRLAWDCVTLSTTTWTMSYIQKRRVI